jgi:quinol-cytochrome oxidoreductase complex cytochrome b subunit
LGGIALTAFIGLAATGVLLMFYYIPEPTQAYNSILYIEEHVFGGKFIRSFHRMSGNIILIVVFLHTLRVVFTGAFVFRSYNWVIGMFLMVLLICSGYTGYLLPMDQLAYWATQTGIELFAILPGGDHFRTLLLPDGIDGRLTLIRFYALHVAVLPILITLLITIHFYRVRRDKGVLPYL